MPRTNPDRMLAAELAGEARRLAAAGGSITEAHEAIETLAAGRYDLIAQEAGRGVGAWSVNAGRRHPVELLAAGLLVVSGPLDLSLLEHWIHEGQRLGAAPMHRAPDPGH